METLEKEILTLEGIGNSFNAWAELYQLGQRYVFKYKRVYELKWSNNSKTYYLEERKNLRVFNKLPYTLRGRFVAFNASQANKLLERDYFNN